MKSLNLLFLIFSTLAIHAHAENFLYKGAIIESETTKKIVDCGDYQVRLETEKFPLEYEREIPLKFKIEGFWGSLTTVKKVAYVQPKEILIPRPEKISGIKSQMPKNRAYLPTSAICKGSTLIVSYWSGGNCKHCEAFVKFSVVDGVPINPQKLSYQQVKAIK